jgi:very-short-patch-repair endonuclease
MDGIQLDGTYTWRQARDLGATRSQIRTDGQPIARGLFVSRAMELDLATSCRAWSARLPDDAAFGLETAAALLGAPCPARAGIQTVLTPRRVLPQFSGITVHVRTLSADDIVEVGGLRVTSGPQTFLDLAARLSAWDLLPLGDALMRSGAVDPDGLAERLERADRVRGVVRAREWAPRLTAQAASPPESMLRYWLLTSRLPEPEVQVPVLDRWGRAVVHADLGYSRWKVALEYEGRQHAERDQFGRDIDRYSLMAADGWLVLRFAARHTGGPTAIVDRTTRALVSRGWQPC